MRRCRKCYCTNLSSLTSVSLVLQGKRKNAIFIAFLMCVGGMLLGCILALLMIGVFLLL